MLFLILMIGLAALLAPQFFKDKIKAKLLEEVDHNINAEAFFSSLEFSSLKNFPHLTLTLHDVSIVGTGHFRGDTLARAKKLSVSLDIKSILKGEKYEINSIFLEEPLIYARILPSGEANYNIIKQAGTDTSAKQSNFNVNIDDWEISKGRLIYDDKLQKTYIEVGGLDHKGSGDFQSEVSDLDITTKVKDLTLMYNGISYFHKKLFKADLNMEMNFKEKKFTFKDHTFQLGHFKFGFDGYFKLLDSGYETNLEFVVKETSFKSLLSLLPGVYQNDLEGITTKGNFSCDGYIKGVYDAKQNKVPAYHLDLKVKDAMFKYAHLPKAVEKINFHLVAENLDGDPEHGTLDLKTFHFEMDKDPVHGSIFLKGIKDVHLRADIKLKVNLEQLEKMYPIDSLQLKGLLTAEIKVNGHYNHAHKLFPKVDGFITLEKGYVKKNGLPLEMDSIHLNAEVLNNTGELSDTRINLKNMTFLLDEEPFVMSGTISDLKDYDYDLKIDGLLDLEKLEKLYPIANTELKGTMNFDIKARGNVAEIEAKQYDKLNTAGTLEIKNISYRTKDLAFPIHVDDALLTFDDDKIILDRFVAEFGKSNVKLIGHLYNYMPYLLRPESPIKGDLKFDCDTLDMNEWFPSTTPDTAQVAVSTSSADVLVIPQNIDFTFDSDIQSLKFGTMDIFDLDGEIRIKNGVCILHETGFNTLDSKFVLAGDYDPRNTAHPMFDMMIDVKKLDFNKAYQAFVDPKSIAPAQGNFSTRYNLKGEVTPDFSPVYSTLTGSGTIVIDSVAVKGMKVMNHLKNVSKKDEFKDPSLSDVKIDTEIKDGKLIMKPFTFQAGKLAAEVEGWQGFDETMDYVIKVSVPPFHKVRIPITISGTADKPVIKLKNGFKNVDLEKL